MKKRLQKNSRKAEPADAADQWIETACGGRIQRLADTPTIEFNGQTLAFCLPLCKQEYDLNPQISCMAARLKP
jgi:YHS domain-containing protein